MGSWKTKHWSKHWSKKWKAIKESLHVKPLQRELIFGSLLGDGTMLIGKGGRNANFKVEHGLAQKEYVFWKYSYLKSLVFTEPKLSYRYRQNGEKYAKSWWFRTISHPELTKIHEKFYVQEEDGNRKVVPEHIEDELTPLGLAVWIMDDGCYSQDQIDISTYCFTREEISLLKKCFRDKFQVEAKIRADRDKGYRMYFLKEETQKLIPIIRPYIIPSMKYKIGLPTP